MVLKRLILMLIAVVLCAPVHELGHWVVAYFEGVEVLGAGFSYVCVNELSFPSDSSLVLFKAAGLLVTFFPAVLIFIYFWSRKSPFWSVPYTWLTVSPVASRRDFFDIGGILESVALGRGLYVFSITASVVLIAVCFSELLVDENVILVLLGNK